jgi:hypothetical protein
VEWWEDLALDRDGNATQYAMGMRNPFDLAWDPQLGASSSRTTDRTAGMSFT